MVKISGELYVGETGKKLKDMGGGGESLPVGSTMEYTGNDIPTGWEEVNDYSTTEINTGKKWTDGKDIWRKVVNGTLPALNPGSATADASFAHGISNLGTVVNIIGTITYRGQPYSFPILSSNRTITTIMYVNSTNIVIRSSDGWQAGPPVQFILEYTKTS